MKVSSYNKGRTAANVSDKTWVHGTRVHLRPDTVWADERYSKITQKDVNEAQVRHNAREAKELAKHPHKEEHGHGHGHDDHHGHGGKHGKIDHTKSHSHDHLHKHTDYQHVGLKQKRDLYP